MRHTRCTGHCISGKLFTFTSVHPDLLRYWPPYQFFYKIIHLTSVTRYLGQRKYIELLELLYNGSTLLLQHDQVLRIFLSSYSA